MLETDNMSVTELVPIKGGSGVGGGVSWSAVPVLRVSGSK